MKTLLGGQGFNRYMVECESYQYYTFAALQSGFNRYMVECEYLTQCNKMQIIPF